MALLSRSTTCVRPSLAPLGVPVCRPSVVVRADVKQGREYREGDDTVSSPGQAPKGANDALYADQVARVRVHCSLDE